MNGTTMQQRLTLLMAVVATAILPATPAAAQARGNLVDDGSFEYAGDMCLASVINQCVLGPTDWESRYVAEGDRLNQGFVLVVGSGGVTAGPGGATAWKESRMAPADGRRFVALGSPDAVNGSGSISAILRTTPARSYEISFSVARFPTTAGAFGARELAVVFGGTTMTVAVADMADPGTAPSWERVSFTGTATTSRTRLTLMDVSTESTAHDQIAIDNVVVRVVPVQ